MPLRGKGHDTQIRSMSLENCPYAHAATQLAEQTYIVIIVFLDYEIFSIYVPVIY